jgi:prepilin-type N-terminal cleavage/methylation domain-containing protein
MRPHRRYGMENAGFSLVELMVVVAIIGALASVAVVAFRKYMNRARVTEAPPNLKKIFDGARAYFEKGPIIKRVTNKFRRHKFPRNTSLTPNKRCCNQPGGVCTDAAGTNWNHVTWKVIDFEISDPHRFRYRFRQAGRDNNARFTAGAYADLDCDGLRSTYERTGTVNGQGHVVGSSAIFIYRDFE